MIRGVPGLATLAALIAVAVPARADTYEMVGTVGTHPVGAALTIAGDRFTSGHYFYASQVKNIPLTGSQDGTSLTLTEPGGGVFRLKLQGNGGVGGDGSSFSTSVALVGTWTQGAEVLPVKLGFDWNFQGDPADGMYHEVTTEPDAAYEARVGGFLKAVLAGDKAGAAKLVSYPLTVNGRHPLTLKTPASFIAHWNTIFPPAMLAELRTAIPHEMFVHEGQAMVAGGAAWFDAKGASALNEPEVK